MEYEVGNRTIWAPRQIGLLSILRETIGEGRLPTIRDINYKCIEKEYFLRDSKGQEEYTPSIDALARAVFNRTQGRGEAFYQTAKREWLNPVACTLMQIKPLSDVENAALLLGVRKLFEGQTTL